MADKDNESAPGVVCCNLGSDQVAQLFAYAKDKNMTVQAAATHLLGQALVWWDSYDAERRS